MLSTFQETVWSHLNIHKVGTHKLNLQGNFPCLARASFLKGTEAGYTKSEQFKG